MNILSEIRRRFGSALQPLSDDPAPYVAMVKSAQDARFGDFQANCAMPLARPHKANPRDLAAQIIQRLDVADLCTEPEIAGPGFINLRLRDDWLQDHTGKLTADEWLGVRPVMDPRTIVVDYSAPNVAKPMHVGHLRSTVIGDALCRILRFLGHRVIGDNHIGDWGTQFGMIIYGYKHFVDQQAYRNDPVGELARLYRLVNQLSDYHQINKELPTLREALVQKDAELDTAEAIAEVKNKKAEKALKKLRMERDELRSKITTCEVKCAEVNEHPELKSLADAHQTIAFDARQETVKLHAGDEENRRLWNEFVPACLEALQQVYERLDIHFDESLDESYYQPQLAAIIEDLQQQSIAERSEGAICVFIEGIETPFIVRKADGAFTYATTDLATIKSRIEEFQADEILYVIDARQSGHLRLLFGTAQAWGIRGIELRHINFGTIMGQDKRPFKTRSGDTVGLESLIDEAVARARRIVDENDDAKQDDSGNPAPELDETERAAVAEIVGIGGIKYADLRHNRDSDYVFNWEKMLATTGDTATYMQYAFARVCGIFRKGNIDRETLRTSGAEIQLKTPEERALALQLNRFAEAVDDVVAEYRPNILTTYLFETANCFSTFYSVCPVLKEERDSVRTSRLLLCDLTARVLARGLDLLGIQTAERM